MKTKNRKTGKHPKLGIAPSLHAAASRTGISLRGIQAAKSAGCPAFKQNGRCDCDELFTWLASHPETLETAGEVINRDIELTLKVRAERRLIEHRLAVLSRRYVPAELVEKWGAEVGRGVRVALQNLPLLAPSLTGLETAEIAAELKKAGHEALCLVYAVKDKCSEWNPEGSEDESGR